jgi:integrase
VASVTTTKARRDGIRERRYSRTRADGSVHTFTRMETDVDLGIDPITGKRIRKHVSGSTLAEVAQKKRKLLGQRDLGLRANSSAGWNVGSWSLHWVDTVIQYEKAEGTYWSYRGDVVNNIASSPIGGRPLGKLEPPVLAAATGMRQGELLGLRWATDEAEPGLDIERGIVRVREQLVRHRGPARIVDHVKRDSIRDLYLDADVVEIMRRHRTHLLEQQLLAGSAWRENRLVFPTRAGSPQRNTNAWRGFKRLLVRAGLPTDFRFHDQRSTAASLAIADGASLFDVSRMLGHRDVRTTANQYGHLFPEGRREMGQRMGRLVLGELPEAAADAE